MFIHYSIRIIYIYLSEPFHVTIGIRQGGVLSPYLFAVHWWFISWTKQNWSWVYWWSLIEPLKVCWWYLCVLSKCTWVAEYTRCVSVAYAGSHEIIFNCSKTVCTTFKSKTAKSTVIPLLTLGVLRVKFVSHYKYLRIVLDIELSDE